MEERIDFDRVMPASRTWNYTEVTNKHVTHHTITITKDRFTHESEIKETAQAMRQRTDLSLKNVNSVTTYYGLSRNLIGAIIAAIFAVLFLVVAIVGFASDEDMVVLGVVGLIASIIMALAAYLIFKRIKPSFILEIETIITNGILKTTSLSYGNATIDLGKKKGIFSFLFKRNKSTKYKFEMDPAVGNSIVDTIGPFLFDK